MAHGRKRAEAALARRNDFVQATIDAIAQVGYHNVTVETICEAAGASRGLIGHYFTGKDELLLETFRHMADQLEQETKAAARAAGRDPLKKLFAIVHVTFSEPVLSPRASPVWIAFKAAARWSPAMLVVYKSLWRAYRTDIARLITLAARKRGVEVDARLAALTFTHLIDGLCLGWILDPASCSAEEAEAACRRYLMHVLQLDH